MSLEIIKSAEIGPEKLYQHTDVDAFKFDSTADLEDLTQFMGQPRVVESLQFGTGIKSEGYNIFALGSPGTGKQTMVKRFLEERSAEGPVPSDICYVNNFEQSHKPKTLRLHAGRGKEFSEDMDNFIEEVQNALRAAFENEEYQNRKSTITQELQEKQQNAFEEIQKKAQEKGLKVIRSPAGVAFAPMKDGEVIEREDFEKLPEDEQKRLKQQGEELQEESQKLFQKIPAWEREMREKLKDLDNEIARFTVDPMIEELRKKYSDLPDVVSYLDALKKDVIENARNLLKTEEGRGQQQQLQRLISGGQGLQGKGDGEGEPPQHRKYKVNVLVDHGEAGGAPVVYEDNPTYQNLVGRVEHLAQMGMLMTDFNMIRPGALHRANGGYLILDALKVLSQPFAWEGLKRMIKSRQIKIESLGQMYSFISTVSLEPEPVSLNIKVVLLGPPILYYLLRYYDPEFSQLFKVAADFDLEMDRSTENQELFSRMIGTVVRQENLRHFDRGAVGRVMEHAARMAGDGKKLSIHMQRVTDLLRESDYWAGRNGNGKISAEDVQQAIDRWIYRSDRIKERMEEQIKRGIVLIDTEGGKVGQVNGLSVVQLGEYTFGRPSRITARVRMGKGEVVDIEREVEMGGPIHSKGVMILAGFLGERYAAELPLSLSASLVFEQSYGGIEGDSASSAELYALLSAISGIPVKQSVAVTGSVNQHGRIQPIGGVNEKIEGFFDICRLKGLNGEQGVLIPKANAEHLMLKKEVIDAVDEGRFHVYTVETIDQGIEILSGVQAGKPDEQGNYSSESINGRVLARLAGFAEKQRRFRLEKGEEKKGS